NRLRYPMKRSGERGEGKWERICWEEALDTITQRMMDSSAQFGPNSICTGQGTGREYNMFTLRLAGTIGTGNLMGPGHVCYLPRLMVFAITAGGKLSPDFHGWGGEFPKTIVSWGRQMEINNPENEMAVWLLSALDKAKNFIIVDPKATRMASRASLWLQIRPGADAALALGMMHVIITEGLYDKEFVTDWTHGFDKLRERVQEYPPGKVSEITWIPKDKIVKAARMIATDTPGAFMIGEALEASNNCTQNNRTLVCLMAITGNIERPGGMVNWILTEAGELEDFGREISAPKENRQGMAGGDKFKLGVLGKFANPDTIFRQLREGDPKRVRVMHLHGTNPLLCYADSKSILAGLLKMDFLSVADQYMSPTARYADIVLPVAHWLESDGIWDGHGRFHFSAMVKTVEPPGEARSSYWIYNELGRRIEPKYWFDTVEELFSYQLRKANITWEDFKKKGTLAKTGKDQVYYKYKTDYWRKGGGFRTPTGKVELFSTTMEKFGYDPLPGHVEPNEGPYSTPELLTDYPLILSASLRTPYFFLSQHRQVPWLRELHPHPIVQIHPETAKKLDISDGDWVWIETPRGRIKQKAQFFAGIDPRVVMAQQSWWYPERNDEEGLWESNVNVLTTSDLPADPAVGSTTFRALLCKIYRVEEANDG
ncbi:MAG: molybdopterin-dependent oxidoreductase, partial [Desulfatiglandales bacterium]|nr:molybdopterin-dependent oxidoreductase [Desulfatiglandales bacterium]